MVFIIPSFAFSITSVICVNRSFLMLLHFIWLIFYFQEPLFPPWKISAPETTVILGLSLNWNSFHRSKLSRCARQQLDDLPLQHSRITKSLDLRGICLVTSPESKSDYIEDVRYLCSLFKTAGVFFKLATTVWVLLSKTYRVKSQKQRMWSPPLLLNLKEHDWRKKNASIWLWDRVSSWCQQGPARSATISNRLSLAADRCMQGHVSCCQWLTYIYVSSTRYYITSDVKGQGAASSPRASCGIWRQNNWFSFCWGVVTHQTHRRIWRECKSCVWFVWVSGPAELLYCW